MAKGKKKDKDKDKKKKKGKAGKLDIDFEGKLKAKADKKAEKKAAEVVEKAAAAEHVDKTDPAKPKHAAGHWPDASELAEASAERSTAEPEPATEVVAEPEAPVEAAPVAEPAKRPQESVEVEAKAEPERVPLEMPDEDTLFSLSNLFKIFADPTRLRILYSLAAGPKCVADISEAAGVTQGATSHQLRSMKQERLVDFVRDGKQVIYSLADERVEVLLAQGYAYISE